MDTSRLTVACVAFACIMLGTAVGIGHQPLGPANANAVQPQSLDFADVPTDSPFYPFVSWLVARGITGGCAPGLFCPDAPLTRAQMAVFLKTNSLKGSPLAFGMILADGTVNTGSGNFTASYNANYATYEIAIAGHYYQSGFYTTVVTLVGYDNSGLTAVTDSLDGKMEVLIHDASAQAYQKKFNFVTYYSGS